MTKIFNHADLTAVFADAVNKSEIEQIGRCVELINNELVQLATKMKSNEMRHDNLVNGKFTFYFNLYSGATDIPRDMVIWQKAVEQFIEQGYEMSRYLKPEDLDSFGSVPAVVVDLKLGKEKK